MKSIDKYLRLLAQNDVAEIAVASGRLPCAKIDGSFQPVDPAAMSADAIYELLFAAGGSRYVDSLGPKPSTWTFRMDGVGTVAVAAVDKDGTLQARFAVTAREAGRENRDKALADPRPAAFAASPPPAARASYPEDALEIGLEDESRVQKAAAPAPEPLLRMSDPFQPSAPKRSVAARADLYFGQDLHKGANAAPDFGIELDTGSEVTDVSPAENQARVIAIEAPAAAPVIDVGTSASFYFDGTFDSLLRSARDAKASDLHVVAERPVLLRLGGALVPHGENLSAAVVAELAESIIPARLTALFEREGSCDFALQHPEHGRFRANVVRQRTGLKACLRLIGATIPTLDSLGLPASLAEATHHHQGLIVVTGPTGHGKTTTLAAIVDRINSETTHHVITVEDPVEFTHPRKRAMMSQREVGTHTKSFRAALKGSLREDPDVIVIGELRDTETVRIALAASETGHLVIGTMNTPSAAKTIDRLIDLFPPGDQQQVRLTLAGGLKLLVSQRLVPTTNNRGQVAACEVLPGSLALWNLIRDNKTFQIPSLQQRGKALGIVRLDDSLADLVRDGKTTLANALPFAESPDELESKVAGRPAVALPPYMQPKGAAAAKGPDASPAKAAGILSKATTMFGQKKGG